MRVRVKTFSVKEREGGGVWSPIAAPYPPFLSRSLFEGVNSQSPGRDCGEIASQLPKAIGRQEKICSVKDSMRVIETLFSIHLGLGLWITDLDRHAFFIFDRRSRGESKGKTSVRVRAWVNVGEWEWEKVVISFLCEKKKDKCTTRL